MLLDFINQIKKWAANEPLIDAIIFVGSYARGTQRLDSDMDLIIITSDKQHYINNPKIFGCFGEVEKTNIEFYGECTSIRVWYKNGLEVEYGMVTKTWIELPLDFGTSEVLLDGYKVLIDKADLFLPVVSVIPEYM